MNTRYIFLSTKTGSERKHIRLLVRIAVLVLLFLVGSYYVYNGGTWTRKPADLSVLDTENPARRETKLAGMTEITGTVSGFNQYETDVVYLKFGDYPEWHGIAYLKKKDAARLEIGDTVTLRGRIKCNRNYIHIGSGIQVFPVTLPARLVKIQRNDD